MPRLSEGTERCGHRCGTGQDDGLDVGALATGAAEDLRRQLAFCSVTLDATSLVMSAPQGEVRLPEGPT